MGPESFFFFFFLKGVSQYFNVPKGGEQVSRKLFS